MCERNPQHSFGNVPFKSNGEAVGYSHVRLLKETSMPWLVGLVEESDILALLVVSRIPGFHKQ